MNEKFAPELLESKADLVECMLDQIKEMASLELKLQSLTIGSLHYIPKSPEIIHLLTSIQLSKHVQYTQSESNCQ